MYYRPEINLKPEEVLDYLRKSQTDDPALTVEEVLAKRKQKELLDRIRLMPSDMKRNATQKQRLSLKCAKQKQKPRLLLSVPKL